MVGTFGVLIGTAITEYLIRSHLYTISSKFNGFFVFSLIHIDRLRTYEKDLGFEKNILDTVRNST